MSADYADVQPWAYTLAPLTEAIRVHLLRIYIEPVLRDTITIEVTFDPASLRTVDRGSMVVSVMNADDTLRHVVQYPERAGRSGCVWDLVIEGWSGPRGDPEATCYTFQVAGNNL